MKLNRIPWGVVGHYMTSIFRNARKNRVYGFLNLVGLSIGFTTFLLMVIYVHFETHFEDFNHQADRIYRVTHRFDPGDGYASHWARVPFDYINELPHDVPSIKTLIRFQNHERKYIRVGNEKFRPEHAYVTDKEVFEVFDFQLLKGNPRTALAEPHSVVITQRLARKYFGDRDPMNQEISVIGDLDKKETSHRVTGVMKDLPSNTHLPVDMLISFKDLSERSGWAYTYVLLREGSRIEEVAEQMPAFTRKYEKEEDARKLSIIYQPLRDIHLHSNLAREIVPNGSAFYVRIAMVAGIFILIIAVINFMNLSSAMALGRGKEFGMRKIMGAGRQQLILYLLLESIVNHLIAMGLGLAIAFAAFPMLQALVPVERLMSLADLLLILTGTSMVCGIAAALYPVILLVGIRPMETVRGHRAITRSGKESSFSPKRVMVTLQFCMSIVLVGSALVAYHQFYFMNNKNLGLTREQVIAIPGVPDQVKEDFRAFKNYLSMQPGIAGVAACMEVPSREIRDAGPILIEGVNSDISQASIVDVQIIDPDFVPLMGIELLAGENIPARLQESVRDFKPGQSVQEYLLSQPRTYLINETAMRKLGFNSPEEAIRQRINWSIDDMVLDYGPISGVVRDFHQETLKNTVDPVVMFYEPVWLRTFLIKVETADLPNTIREIQAAWDKLFPAYPMEYYFLDDLYEDLYKGERIQLQLLYTFSGLAIVIAFIGLIGLIAFALKTRVREIAVRKVLGATVADLIRMISREYLVVLVIGAALAIPISVYALQQWLATFAYRVEISPYSYALTLGLTGGLLLITIGLQTLRSAHANPAETLRGE